MGLPARRLDATVRGAGRDRETRLRLVRTAPAPKRRAAPAMCEAACRSLFQLTLVVLVALAFFGLARVTLSAKVAEASIDATRLQKTIKAETLVADKLELDKSLLVMPSRIESIAAGSMEMTTAAPVRYLPMPRAGALEATPAEPEARANVTAGGAPTNRMAMLGTFFGAALDVTEKEARALLVGDAGLAQMP